MRQIIHPAGKLLSDVEPEEAEWAWENLIPLGAATLLVGDQGVGKSTILSDLAARFTRDDFMPDGSPCGAPGGTVWIGMEEKISQAILPRLIAAGARRDLIVDLSKVDRAVEGRVGEYAEAPFDITKDLGELRRAIKRVNASLVIIDPLLAAVSSRTHIWANGVASDVFMEVNRAAERLGVAIVIVNHFSKRSRRGKTGAELLDCMLGGVALSQRARSVLLLAKDEAEPGQAILSQLKHSLAPEVPALVLKHDGRRVTWLRGVNPEQQEINEANQYSDIRKQVLAILKEHQESYFRPNYIAQELGVNYDTTKSALRRMEADGLIERGDRGFYRCKQKKVRTDAPKMVKKLA